MTKFPYKVRLWPYMTEDPFNGLQLAYEKWFGEDDTRGFRPISFNAKRFLMLDYGLQVIHCPRTSSEWGGWTEEFIMISSPEDEIRLSAFMLEWT